MLDDQSEMARLDPEDMRGFIANFAEQLQESLDVPLPDLSGIDAQRIQRVVFAGMGGSGAGGAYATAYIDAHGGPIARVVHEYEIPEWVDDRTLVVATSYSGNTEETLASVAEAAARGAPWVAVTSGGDLAKAAKRHGAPLVEVPTGFQPRAAFGWLLVPVLRVLAGLELIDRNKVEASVKAAIPLVRQVTEQCGLSTPEADNPAKRLALALQGRSVLLMSDGPYECVAERIRCQLNENSKTKAFVRTLPEANHNDTVAWMSDRGGRDWAALWLGRFTNPSVKVREEFTRGLLEERGVPAHVLPRYHEDDQLADMVALTHFGDWVSLYMAYLNREDPSDVSVIPQLKAKCADTGVLAEARKRLQIA